MIVIDSSPLISILKDESDADIFRKAINDADRIILGAPNKLEVMMVATGRFGVEGRPLVEDLLQNAKIEVVDWTDAMVSLATDAFLKFGKGQHKAKLNFGDCMAYALAKSLNAPLLYKGADFAQTDIRSAL